MIKLTLEQAQQIEEALEYARNVCAGSNWSTDNTDEALASIREVLAEQSKCACDSPAWCTKYKKCNREVLGLPKAQPVKQEPLMDYERINALRDGEQNGAEDAYFFVRPENDTPSLRKMFCQGFERGFHKGLKYAAPVSAKREWVELTDYEIVRLYAESPMCDSEMIAFARAAIAAFNEKSK